MFASPKSLFALTARDLMTPAVLALPQEMRLPAAARLLRRQQVSGAPVIDREGRCVGVLSTTDFMRWAEGEAQRHHVGCTTYDALGLEWEVVETEELPQDEVRVYMTTNPVCVTPETSIVRMAHIMQEGHIHRLIVLDEERKPVGIVSTTDILAAVARGEIEKT